MATEKRMQVLGIMSGTSIDSADYAICSVIADGPIQLRDFWQVPFPAALRKRLHSAAAGEARTFELAQLHHDLGRFYARGAKNAKVDLVGLHGQTVFHNPKPPAATLQIGEPAYLAESLGAPVVSTFRVSDLAAGGQGAPLATIFHQAAFAEQGKHIAVNNLGGISNVTSLDFRRPRRPHIVAFDTGPANMLIDMAAAHFSGGKKRFDRDGQLARQGRRNEQLLAALLKDPFFREKPPKSTGRELFGEPFFRGVLFAAKTVSPEDLMATLTAFTAETIALNYRLHLSAIPDRVVLCGGGAANPILVREIIHALQALNPDVVVQRSDDLGWPNQAIEPAAFALLAWLRWNGQAGNIPETTGATHSCLLGQITAAAPRREFPSPRARAHRSGGSPVPRNGK